MKLALTAVLILSLAAMADTAYQRIMEDDNLTVDQRALFLVYSVISPERLPAAYTLDAQAPRSGTPALHEAMLLSDQVSAATLEEMLTLANRPSLSGPVETFVTPGGYFRFHYTKTGADAVTDAYAAEMGGYFDDSWVTEVNTLGYFHPPSDNGVGGDNLYDVYIKSLSGGTLGYTTSAGEYKPPDSTHSCSASHIVMNTNLGYNYLTTTSSHEFQHAIQMSYDYEEPTWFMENCAVWMEDQVFPDVNDWTGFWSEGAVRKPWLDIDSANPYWYGSSVWPRMMGLMYGVDAVRDVWQNCADKQGANMWDAIDDMFISYGSDFENGFMAYGLWRYFTGPLYNENYNLWDPDLALPASGPAVLPYNNHSSLPASGDEGNYPPETRGIAWIKVDLEDYQGGWVQFDFDGRDNFDFNVGAFVYNENTFQFDWYDCEAPSGDITISVPTTGWDYAVFFPAFMTETSLSGNHDYTITYTTGIEEGETFGGTELTVQQNPMTAGSAVSFTVPDTGNADLSLVDLTGRRVATIYSGPAQQGVNLAEFQGGVASGTYFVVLRHGRAMEAQRVSVLR